MFVYIDAEKTDKAHVICAKISTFRAYVLAAGTGLQSVKRIQPLLCT